MKLREFMTLQLFADPAPTEPASGGDPKPTEPASGGDPKPADPPSNNLKTSELKPDPKYTDADVDRILNQKFAEWEKKQQKKVDEATRLGEMNAQERAEHERAELEKKVNELLKKEELANMSKQARSMLSEKGINISDDLLAMLVSTDADKTKSSVDSFITLFQSAVKTAVTEALKGGTPKTGGASGITKDQIMAVKNRAERQKLIKENMHLFK